MSLPFFFFLHSIFFLLHLRHRLTSILPTYYTTYVSKLASSCGHDLRDSMQSYVFCQVREYASGLNALRSTNLRASDRVLTVCDRHIVLSNSIVWAWHKHCLHGSARAMSVSRCVGSDDDFHFVCCYEEVQHEKKLLTLVQDFDGQLLTEVGLSLVVLRRPFSHLDFTERFDCDCKLRLHRFAQKMLAG